MAVVYAGVLAASLATGAVLGGMLGYRAGSYATWRLVTWRLTRDS